MINNESGVPGTTQFASTLVEVFDDASAIMVAGVTHLEFWFYSVDNTLGEMRDPFDGVNPYTGVDDGLTLAFVSPLVWEIDVFGELASSFLEADFDRDGAVDGDDFLLWQTGFGTPSDATKMDGDYDNDGDVDGDDFLGWQAEFGSGAGSASAVVPEPVAVSLAILFALGRFVRRRQRHCGAIRFMG